MNISYKATNTTLTPAIKAFIEDKLSSVEKFLKPEHKIHVELEVSKRHKNGMFNRAEVDIKPNGCYAESYGMDFYSAMDLVMPKIREQLAKAKEKKLSKIKKARRMAKGV
jgi:ribosomal subunit interface protein